MSVKHKQTMKPLFNEIHATKEDFYKLLTEQPTDSVLNEKLHRIGDKQEMIDQKIYNHFQGLRQVCTPEQLPRYDSVIQKVLVGMINPKRGNDKKK
jgi:protein CpxP